MIQSFYRIVWSGSVIQTRTTCEAVRCCMLPKIDFMYIRSHSTELVLTREGEVGGCEFCMWIERSSHAFLSRG